MDEAWFILSMSVHSQYDWYCCFEN